MYCWMVCQCAWNMGAFLQHITSGGTSSTFSTFSRWRMVQKWGVSWLIVHVWIGDRPTQGKEQCRTCALGMRCRMVLLVRESPWVEQKSQVHKEEWSGHEKIGAWWDTHTFERVRTGGVTCDNCGCDHFDCRCVGHHLCKERWGWKQAIIMSAVWWVQTGTGWWWWRWCLMWRHSKSIKKVVAWPAQLAQAGS